MIPAALVALVESLQGSQGSCFFVFGPVGSGKSQLLAGLQGALVSGSAASSSASAVPPSSPADADHVRWTRQQLAGRRLAVCRVSLDGWAALSALPLQAVLSAEVARQLPGLPFAFSTRYLAQGGLGETLAERGLDGVVLLADDLDRFVACLQAERLQEDLVFLDELAGQVAIYLLPIWVVFTLREEIPGSRMMGGKAGRALRDRYTPLWLGRGRWP